MAPVDEEEPGERLLRASEGRAEESCKNPDLPDVEAGFSRASCRKQRAGLKTAATKSVPRDGFSHSL